jgi:Flp pilus assembly protein TadG
MRIVNKRRRRLSDARSKAERRRDGEKGQALVEIALVTPLLLLILFAITQFGIMLSEFITLTDAARTGARLLALEQGNQNPCDPAVLAMVKAASTAGVTTTNVNSYFTISFTSESTPVTTPVPDYCVSTAGAASTYTYPATNTASTAGAEVEGDEATMTVSKPFQLNVFGLKITSVTLRASASDAIE